ncbi:MAG: hypothetical protein AAF193_03895, partial [Bacteroidota bacterium]
MKNWLEPLRNSHELVYNIVLLAICWGLLLYLYPRTVQFEYEAVEGREWTHEDVYAPSSFEVFLTDDEVSMERTRIEEERLMIFSYRDGAMSNSLAMSDSLVKYWSATLSGEDSIRWYSQWNNVRRRLNGAYESPILDDANDWKAKSEIGLSKK